MPTFRDDIHRGTKVPLVKTDDLDDLAITTEKLADGSVTNPKLAEDSVSTEKIQNGAITTEKLDDGSVTNSKLHDDSVSTEKIIDHNVTWDKLNEEVQEVVQAGTGVDGKLINDMQEWNERIAALESAKLTTKTTITVNEVTEYQEGVVINYSVALSNSNGSIERDKDYTDKKMTVSVNGNENDFSVGEVSLALHPDRPSAYEIEVYGSAKYKGVDAFFPASTKNIYAVLPSYIGYVDDYNNWNKTGQKLVKHSLSGSYNVTNGYSDTAYMVVAVPIDGAVNAVNRIVQHGTLDAEQQFDKVTKDGYTLYVCKTKHNPGTYNFVLS